MKKRELQEFKNKPIADLREKLRKTLAEMEELKFNIATGKVKSLKEKFESKKTIAQLKTLIARKERSEKQTEE